MYSNENDFKIPPSVKIALIGVPEDRFSDGAGEIKLPGEVRRQLYALSSDTENIVDLGNLRTGKTLPDTYFCLQHVVSELHARGMIVVIIGGTTDVFYGSCLAFEGRKTNLTGIIPSLKLPEQSEQHPLNRMIFDNNPKVHYCNIGYQSYYVHRQ
jgi:arginase family enzyme